MIDGSHIDPAFRHILGFSDRDRINFIDYPRWVDYPVANKIITALRDLMDKPQKPRMSNLLIVGPPNNGKTTIIRRFSELYGESTVDDNEEPIKPVLVAEAPPSADEKALYISILERFHAPYRATDPSSKLRYQVIHLFRHCHVRLLVIDEFHSLLTGSAIKQREVMNALKLMCNELSVPIIGVGTPEAVRVLHTDPQHASRFDIMSVPHWTAGVDFQRLLAGFEMILPLKKPSNISSRELAPKIFALSDGNIGNVHRLLMECAKAAIQKGTEQITPDIIESKSWVRPTQGLREIGA